MLAKFCTFSILGFLIMFFSLQVNAQETNQCRQRINQISQTIKKTNNVNVDFSITNDNHFFFPFSLSLPSSFLPFSSLLFFFFSLFFPFLFPPPLKRDG